MTEKTNQPICKYEIPYIISEFDGYIDSTIKEEYMCSIIEKTGKCPYSTTICNYKKQKLKEENLNKLVEAKERFYKGL